MGNARENFVRLAEARTSRLLKDLDLLGNLANRSNYSYTEEDVKFIFKAIGKKCQDVEAKFKITAQTSGEQEFRLPK